MQELYYATTNAGKFAEVKRFFAQHAPDIIIKQCEEDLIEIQTNDQQFIAVQKAQQAWHKLQSPVLVDDAGIYFKKYAHFPGTMSKFVYQGIGFEGLFKLVDPHDEAYFKVSLAYAAGPHIHVFEDTCNGYIIHPKNFEAPPTLPYLDIFVPEGEVQTFAQLGTSETMDRYNPRRNALKKFLAWYKEH
jgi:XTP/dITP diphosphohydrolase